MKFLIVEDSDVGRMVIADELEDFEVIETERSSEALDQLRKDDSITAVLLANTLREESSYDLCKSIRDLNHPNATVPIFLLGSSDDSDHYREGFEAGASAFLEKPFEKTELTRTLMHLRSTNPMDKNTTILVVDDSASVRVVLRKALEDVGFEVTEAENGREALTRLEEETPDLISTDLQMPEMDGHTFVKTLREQDGYKTLPVLMLTSVEDEETRSEMLASGVNEFMTKPFQSGEFLKALMDLLYQDDNFTGKTVYVADDSSMARNNLTGILETNSCTYETFENGVALLERLDEVQNGEAPEPDLFMLDVLMPKLDGIKTLESIRGKDNHTETPVIMVSSYDKPQAVIKSINEGANDFVGKPYDDEEILEHLRLHLNR